MIKSRSREGLVYGRRMGLAFRATPSNQAAQANDLLVVEVAGDDA